VNIVSNIFVKLFKRELLGKDLKWNIGYLRGDWSSAVFHRAKVIPNPKGFFYADPFIFEYDDRVFIFFEEYSFSESKGWISVFEIINNNHVYLGKVLEEDFHLSFPFILEEDGKIYMIPESSAAGDIRIYECIKFPMEWEFRGVILRNVSASDSIVLKHNDLWWLFTNIDSGFFQDHSSNLSIFYSNDLLNGLWIEHVLNPIYSSSLVSRNGGMLVDKLHGIYRVAQSQGFDQYGESLKIFKIDDLSPNFYKESLFAEVKPYFHRNIKGVHHISSSPNFTVFDFAKFERK
jgi:hypothetical protein